MAPKVITITNQKGGTGKTTLSALLGYALAKMGYKVLLIDLDPQAHLSSFFIRIPDLERISDGFIEMAQGAKFSIRKVDLSARGKIGIVPSGLNYIVSVYRGSIPSWDPYAIHKRISTEPAINRHYDYIICDSPPELFPPTIWGLYAADYILIPSNFEELSLLGVKILIKDVLPDVFYSSKKDVKVLGVSLINITKRYGRTSLQRLNDNLLRYLRRLPRVVRERFYREPLFKTVVYRYGELKDLTYRPRRLGTPLYRVIERNPELRENIMAFARELLERADNYEGIE